MNGHSVRSDFGREHRISEEAKFITNARMDGVQSSWSALGNSMVLPPGAPQNARSRGEALRAKHASQGRFGATVFTLRFKTARGEETAALRPLRCPVHDILTNRVSPGAHRGLPCLPEFNPNAPLGLRFSTRSKPRAPRRPPCYSGATWAARRTGAQKQVLSGSFFRQTQGRKISDLRGCEKPGFWARGRR
jgi:hypothetical protein